MMSYMSLLLGVSLCFINHQEGRVQTVSSSLTGSVSVNFDANMVIIKSGSVYEIVHANNLVSAISYEGGMKTEYVSAKYGEGDRDFVFKVISKGELTLVYRENITKSSLEGLKYPAFHIYKDRKIVRSVYGEKDVFKAMKSEKEAIKDFLSTNIFYADDPQMMKELFDFYNQLKGS